MIENREAATTLFNAAYDAYNTVFSALEQITPQLSSAELAEAKKAVGRIMGEILAQLTEPILDQHPELTPDEWID
jgi:hypothetical protein